MNIDYDFMAEPFEHKDFEQMNRKEAGEYFDWFMGQIDNRIEYMKKCIAEEGAPFNADYSPESLIPLWEWFGTKIELVDMKKEEFEKVVADAPEWIRPYVSSKELSLLTLAVGIDVAIYFAEVLRKNSESKIKWGFSVAKTCRQYKGRPVLLGFIGNQVMYPMTIIQNMASRDADLGHDPQRMIDAYHAWEIDIKK